MSHLQLFSNSILIPYLPQIHNLDKEIPKNAIFNLKWNKNMLKKCTVKWSFSHLDYWSLNEFLQWHSKLTNKPAEGENRSLVCKYAAFFIILLCCRCRFSTWRKSNLCSCHAFIFIQGWNLELAVTFTFQSDKNVRVITSQNAGWAVACFDSK